MTSQIDMGLTTGCSFFILQESGTGMLDKLNPSLVFSGDRKIPPQGQAVSVGNEACSFKLLNKCLSKRCAVLLYTTLKANFNQ